MDAMGYFLKLCYLCFGKCMKIVKFVFHVCVLNNKELEYVLNKKKHELFHLYIPTVQCCECISSVSLASPHKNSKLDKKQMEMLYNKINDPGKADHVKKSKNKTTQHCICNISAKPGITAENLDIILVTQIARMYCSPNLFPSEFDEIRRLRNELVHTDCNTNMTQQQFEDKWKDLQDAALALAGKINSYYRQEEKTNIEKIKTTNVDLKMVLELEKSEDMLEKFLEFIQPSVQSKVEQLIQPLKDQLSTFTTKIGNLTLNVEKPVVKDASTGSAGKDDGSHSASCSFSGVSDHPGTFQTEHGESVCCVEWKITTPGDWDVDAIISRLNDASFLLSRMFKIQFVYKNCFIIVTLAPMKLFFYPHLFYAAAESFLKRTFETVVLDVKIKSIVEVNCTIIPGISVNTVDPKIGNLNEAQLLKFKGKYVNFRKLPTSEQNQWTIKMTDSRDKKDEQEKKPECGFCHRDDSVEDVCGTLHVVKKDGKVFAAHKICMAERDIYDGDWNSYNPYEDPQKERQTQLNQDFKTACKSASPESRSLNIAVIGSPGCGKSSFINTALTAIRGDHWMSHVQAGDYGCTTDSGTHVTNHFQSFRAAEDYYREDPEVPFPTLIDINGLQNCNDRFNRILLKALLDGKIGENENLIELRNEFEENRGGFEEKLYRRNDYLKIDRIIVVASADPDSQLDTELFECIGEVAQMIHEYPVFGIMTKKDRFPGGETVEQRKLDFIRSLGISEDNYKSITNYCPDFDGTLQYHSRIFPEIDIPVLELLIQIVNPRLRVVRQTTPKLHIPNLVYDTFSQALQALLIGILIYWFTVPKIDFPMLTNLCSNITDHAKCGTKNMCSRRKELTSFPILQLVLYVCVIFFAVPFLLKRYSK